MPTFTARNNLYKTSATDTISLAGAGQELATRIDNRLDRWRHSSGSKYLFGMGMYEEAGEGLTGWMVVQTNIPFTTGIDKMIRFDVRGYTYWAYNNIIDFSVNAYILNGGVFSPDFHNRGSMLVKDVRLVRNNSTNNLAIVFASDNPAGGDVWRYPKVVVDGWIAWGTEIPDTEFNGVTISRQTSLANYTTVHTFLAASWQPLSLLNGWVAYDGGGVGNHATPRCRRVGEQVFVEGVIKNGPNTSNIAVLPSGFRHTGGPLIFNMYGNGGQSRVDVWADGTIVANGIPNNLYLGLNGITFSVGNA